MTDVLGRIDLENAKRDADDLGAVVNGAPTDADVVTRLGRSIPRVAKLVSLIQAEEETASSSAETAVAAADLATEAEASFYSKPYPTAAFSILSAYEEALCEPNGWRHSKWPGGSTKSEGLAAMMGEAGWPAYHGQRGVDFGNLTPEGSMLAGYAHPHWDGSVHQVLVSLYNTDGPVLISGYDVDGSIEFVAMDAAATVRDCVVRGIPGSLPYRNIMQNDASQPLYIENCQLTACASQNVSFGNGHVKRCELYEPNGQTIVFNGTVGLIDECFMRKVSLVSGAHGDGVQVLQADDLKVTRSDIYVPDGSLDYGEGVTTGGAGVTAAIFLSPNAGGTAVNSAFIAGNLLAGGAYTLYYVPGSPGFTVRNVCTVNNIIGGAGYVKYGGLYMGPIAAAGYVRKNMLFFGNIMSDGSPLKQEGVDVNGIWDFEKAALDARTRYVGQKVGYLDWNGDCKPEWNRSL